MTLTYAKAGGPPEFWAWLRVLDIDSGLYIENVTEVNTIDGWLLRYKINDDGHLAFEIVDGEKKRIAERVTGNFEIQRVPES